VQAELDVIAIMSIRDLLKDVDSGSTTYDALATRLSVKNTELARKTREQAALAVGPGRAAGKATVVVPALPTLQADSTAIMGALRRLRAEYAPLVSLGFDNRTVNRILVVSFATHDACAGVGHRLGHRDRESSRRGCDDGSIVEAQADQRRVLGPKSPESPMIAVLSA